MATTSESTPPGKTTNGKPAPAKGLPRGKLFSADGPPPITVKDLTMAFGNFVLMKDLNFTVNHSDIFIVMGGSGSGKSTLLRHMLGLIEPAKGEVLYGDFNFTKAEPLEREAMLRKFGVLYQSGALWSSMTLAENVGLPLEEFSDLTPAEIGFAETCPDVAVPPNGAHESVRCGGAVSTLADLVSCVGCVTESKVDCMSRARAPQLAPYPIECNP